MTRLCFLFLTFAWSVGLSSTLLAQERKAEDYTLPSFTGSPEFCFLRLPSGPDQHWKVLLVRDGSKLYFDMNANGDLTEAAEVFDSTVDRKSYSERDFSFEIDQLKTGSRVHSSFMLTVNPLGNYAGMGNDEIKALLEKTPNASGYMMSVEIQHDSLQGNGLDGRVVMIASFQDLEGIWQFGQSINTAPTINCGVGMMEVRPMLPTKLRPGAKKEFTLVVGNSGNGPGTFASIGYEGTIPEHALPKLRLETVDSDSGETTYTSAALARRC